MNLSIQVSDALKQLAGLRTDQPKTVEFADADGSRLALDFKAVDSMSCSFWEMRLCVPALDKVELSSLKSWAEHLAGRVTYLLENIGPLECDEEGNQLLLRSTPPQRNSDETKFYEIILQARADGSLSLRRFRSANGQAGREQVDIQMTCEALRKLIDDVFESIPIKASGGR